MPIRANALAVMAKAPIAGRVKTRLVPPLTGEQAAEFSRVLLLDQLEHLTRLDDVDLYVAFAPDDAESLMRSLVPERFECFRQRGGDLGERMNEVFAELWRRGHRKLVLIGSDVPAIHLDFFHQAFLALSSDNRQVVLGPSQDGGYYLVGVNQPTPEIFAGMTWSHPQVLAQTTEKLSRLAIEFALLPAWFDLDTIEDLDRLQTLANPAIRLAMKRTLEFLRRLNVRTPTP